AVRGTHERRGAGEAGARVVVRRAHPRAEPVAAAALLPGEDDGEGAGDAVPGPAAPAARGARVPRAAAPSARARGGAAAREAAPRRSAQLVDVPAAEAASVTEAGGEPRQRSTRRHLRRRRSTARV